MAQTGYTPISLYYTTTAAATPLAANLTSGELAINITDGKLFYKDNGGTVQVLATKGGVGSATNTQVLYNSSGLVVGSANLTFNGTTLTAGGFTTTGATATGTLSATGDIDTSQSNVGNFYGVRSRNTNTGTAASNGFAVGNNVSAFGLTLTLNSGTYTGAANYAYLLNQFNAPLILGANGTGVATVSATGLSVTGTLNASGNSILGTSANATVNVGGGGFTQAGYGLVAVNGTSGGMVKFGVSAAAAGQIYGNAGGIAIDTLAGATNIDHYINSSLVTRTSSTGLAVTGTLSSTGAFSQIATSGNIANTVQQTTTNGARVSTTYAAKTSGGATANAQYVIGVGISGDNGFEIYDADAGALRAKFTTTGLAVTGTLSATTSVGVDRGVLWGSAGNTYYGHNENASGNYIASAAASRMRLAENTIIFNRASAGTAGNPITWSESMRIDSSGNLLVGTTSNTAGYALKVGGANANILISADSPNGATLLCDSAAAGSKPAYFGHVTSVAQAQVRCGGSGGVYLSDGATSWTAISDERQKTDFVPITDALVKVDSLRAVTGRYVWDEKRRAFLIAQEVQQVLPEAVDVADDADGTLGLAYTDVIPLLVASIKELNAKVAALEAA